MENQTKTLDELIHALKEVYLEETGESGTLEGFRALALKDYQEKPLKYKAAINAEFFDEVMKFWDNSQTVENRTNTDHDQARRDVRRRQRKVDRPHC